MADRSESAYTTVVPISWLDIIYPLCSPSVCVQELLGSYCELHPGTRRCHINAIIETGITVYIAANNNSQAVERHPLQHKALQCTVQQHQHYYVLLYVL